MRFCRERGMVLARLHSINASTHTAFVTGLKCQSCSVTTTNSWGYLFKIASKRSIGELDTTYSFPSQKSTKQSLSASKPGTNSPCWVSSREGSGKLFLSRGISPLIHPANNMDVLKETNFTNLGAKKTGKVRDIYEQPERLILVTTDRHSSFDRIIAHIPHKGQVLNQVSAWWFEQTKDIIGNHVLGVPDPNVTVGKRCTLVPVEAVMRGYLTGVTDTSIWTRYSKGVREFGGVTLPDGMKKNQKLPEPIFDPTTKEETHDRTLTPAEMIAEGFITAERFEELKRTALALFARGQEVAA